MVSEAPQWWNRRMPDAPVTEPWDFSAAALIRPHLPAKLRRLPGLLDRLGAVRLTPSTIGIDTAAAVPWTRMTEIRTCSVGEVAAALTQDMAGQIARLVPVPGAGFAARTVTSRIIDVVTARVTEMMQTAVRERGAHAQVPCLFRHRARWRTVDVSPGLVSSAVLCLQQVSTSVTATAQLHGILIAASPG